MAKLKTIALTLSGLSAMSGAAYAQTAQAANPSQVGMAMMRLNSSMLDQAKAQVFGSGSLWASLRKDFRIGEVNPELVRLHENKFSAGKAYFDRTINRSKPYMHHIATEVKKRNMPAEIALLPFIESAYVTKARSHVGASGLWQFMPATGRHYGLERTALYDGRHDVYAATNAALNYLEYLHRMFGDWSLALAAYNWGEGNVSRAVNRARAQGLEPSYENLRMPQETRNYVPKLLAVRNIVSNPQSFGMNVSDISNQPYFKAVSVDQPMDQGAITRMAGISESEFLALNPAFNAPVFVPKHNRKLLLPVSAVSAFEKNVRNAKPETLLSWDVYTTLSNSTLNAIAADTGMSVAELKRLNGLSGNQISAERSILVAKNSSSTAAGNINFIDQSHTPDSYQANVAAAEPVQIQAARPAVAETVRTVAAAAPVAMPTQAAAVPVDFVSRSQAENSIPATSPAADVNVAAAMPSENPASESKPISLAANLTATDSAPATAAAENLMAAVSAPAPETTVQTASATPAASVASLPEVVIETAISEPLPLPTQPRAEAADDLMALVDDASLRLNAAEAVRSTVAKANAQEAAAEAAAKARAQRLAENKAKQQARVEARLARANNTPAPAATLAAGTHRVGEGDTLFNISRRYNVSVADLITANNIKGNNIRQGDVLRVTAAPAKARNAEIQNVSYTVRKGDTINTIANRFNVDVNDIRRWNQNTRTVTPGQRLKLIGS